MQRPAAYLYNKVTLRRIQVVQTIHVCFYILDSSNMPPISGRWNKVILQEWDWCGEMSTSILVKHEPIGRMSMAREAPTGARRGGGA